MATAIDTSGMTSQPSMIPAEESTALDGRVRAAQITALHRQARISNLASPVVAAIVGYIIHSEGNGAHVLVWLAVVLLASVARGIVHHRFERTEPASKAVSNSTKWTLLISICVSGLAWGVGTSLLFPGENLALQVFMIVAVLGMGAGAAASFGPYFPAFAVYVVPLILPISATLLMQHTDIQGAFGVFGIIFLIVLLLLGLTGHRNFAASVKLEFENAYLSLGIEHARRRLEDAVDSMSEGFALFDANDRLVLASERLRQLVPELTEPANIHVTYQQFAALFAKTGLSGASSEQVEAWIEKLVSRHRAPGEAIELELANGQWLRVGEQLTSDGSVVAIFTDLTQLKTREAALAESEQKFHDFTKAASDWVFELDADLRFTAVSGRHAEVTGYGSDFLIGKKMTDIPSLNQDADWRAVVEALAKQQPYHNCRITHPDVNGEPFHFLSSGIPVFSDDRTFLGYRGTGSDITAERKAVAALEESEERYRQLVENSPDLISIHKEGRFIFVNPAGARLVGVSSPDDLIGRRVFEFIHSDHHADLRISQPTVQAGRAEGATYEFRALRDDGTEFEAEGVSLEFTYLGGPATLSIVRDITLRKLAQVQLVQMSKLATLGEMAAGITHELNQPLNVIRMAADSSLILMESGKTDREFERKQFERISAHAVRMADIVSHMAIFSRREDDDSGRELVDPLDSVTAAVSMVRDYYSRDDVYIEVELPDDTCLVYGNPIRLEQVILNLLTNARDALVLEKMDPETGRPFKASTSGRIQVSARYEPRDANDAASQQRNITIRIEDNGGGISAEVLDRVFDPFFTTKRTGQGTGLGLAIGYSIVDGMGGRIEVSNGPEGARFDVSLPVASELDIAESMAQATPTGNSSETKW